MSNNRVLLLSLISIAILVGQAAISNRGYAQETKTFTAPGVYEIGGNISYKYSSYIFSGSTMSNYNSISFLPYIGYFITDNIELGFNPIGITSYWNSNMKNTLYSIFFAPSYNFKMEGTVYPFIEAQLGYTNEFSSSSYSSNTISTTYDGFSWGVRAGVKLALSGHGLINLGLQYQQISLKESGVTAREGTNDLTFSAGFTLWY